MGMEDHRIVGIGGLNGDVGVSGGGNGGVSGGVCMACDSLAP